MIPFTLLITAIATAGSGSCGVDILPSRSSFEQVAQVTPELQFNGIEFIYLPRKHPPPLSLYQWPEGTPSGLHTPTRSEIYQFSSTSRASFQKHESSAKSSPSVDVSSVLEQDENGASWVLPGTYSLVLLYAISLPNPDPLGLASLCVATSPSFEIREKGQVLVLGNNRQPNLPQERAQPIDDQPEPIELLIRIEAVGALGPIDGQLIYALDCLSHGCSEVFLVRIEGAKSASLPKRFLLTYSFPPGGYHPTKAQLDAQLLWRVGLVPGRMCDDTWEAHRDREWKLFDENATQFIVEKAPPPCFLAPYGELEVAQE